MTEFTCDMCGGTFEQAWSDEEAVAEAEDVFGVVPEDASVVCSECYENVMVAAEVGGYAIHDSDKAAQAIERATS